MPQRLVGVRGFVSGGNEKGATVKVFRYHDGLLYAKILSITQQPPLGSIELLAWSGNTYVKMPGQCSVVSEDVMTIRPLDVPELTPLSVPLKSLVTPISAMLLSSSAQTQVTIMAGAPNAFAFLADSAPPSGNTLRLIFRLEGQPVNIEVRMKELHREQDRYRGAAVIQRIDRITTGRLEQFLRETA